jgi:hypothetical protein
MILMLSLYTQNISTCKGTIFLIPIQFFFFLSILFILEEASSSHHDEPLRSHKKTSKADSEGKKLFKNIKHCYLLISLFYNL